MAIICNQTLNCKLTPKLIEKYVEKTPIILSMQPNTLLNKVRAHTRNKLENSNIYVGPPHLQQPTKDTVLDVQNKRKKKEKYKVILNNEINKLKKEGWVSNNIIIK